MFFFDPLYLIIIALGLAGLVLFGLIAIVVIKITGRKQPPKRLV